MMDAIQLMLDTHLKRIVYKQRAKIFSKNKLSEIPDPYLATQLAWPRKIRPLAKPLVKSLDRIKKSLKRRSVHEVQKNFPGLFLFNPGFQWQCGSRSMRAVSTKDVMHQNEQILQAFIFLCKHNLLFFLTATKQFRTLNKLFATPSFATKLRFLIALRRKRRYQKISRKRKRELKTGLTSNTPISSFLQQDREEQEGRRPILNTKYEVNNSVEQPIERIYNNQKFTLFARLSQQKNNSLSKLASEEEKMKDTHTSTGRVEENKKR